MPTNLVKPVILYSSELWGDEKCDILEKLQLIFVYIFWQLINPPFSNMVYGELGITPLDIDIKVRMIVYLVKSRT